MPILLTCPKCKTRCRIPDQLMGKSVQCAKCGSPIRATAGSSDALNAGTPKAARPKSRTPEPPLARRRRPADYEDDDDRPRRRDAEDDYDDDDDDDRPRRRRQRSARASTLSPVAIVGALGGGFVVVLLLALLSFVARRSAQVEVAVAPPQVAPIPAGQVPQRPALGNPANPQPAFPQPAVPQKPIRLKPAVPVGPLDVKAPAAADPVFADPNIIAAGPFDRVIFPRTPARVVALATSNLGQDGKISVYNIETRKKIAEFSAKGRWDHFALSEDGSRIAGFGPFKKEIGVLTKDGPQNVAGLPDHVFSLFFEFTATNQLFVTYQEFAGAQKYALVDTAANKQTAAAQGPKEEHDIRAIGPDRQTYAAIVARSIVIRRLTDLQAVRQLPIAPRAGKGFFFSFQGLAFSPDGTEIAALVEDDRKSRLVCWTWQNGKAVCDHVFDKKLDRQFGGETPPIEWLPDGTGWLVQGQHLVEKKSGKILMTVPPSPGEWGKGNKRFLDSETQIVAKESGGAKTLELVRIKRDEVDVALKIAAEGGDPMASRLPPLAKTSLAGVKQLNPPQGRVGWKLAIEPARERMPGANVPVRAAMADIEQLCLAPGRAVVVSLVAAEAGAIRSKVRVESFDLRTGGAGQEVELFQASAKMGATDHLHLPHTSRFMADLSMDGGRFALREPAEKTRVDVWTIPDGKHVIGLAPFAGDADPTIAWFGVVDDLLLTASTRRLVAWKLPEGKAVYSLVGEFVPGSFAFSPAREHLVVMAGPNVYALSPKTGAVEGQLPFPDEVDVPRVASVSFRPDGKALVALVPELAATPRKLSLEQSIFAFGGPCRLIRWNLDDPNEPRALTLQQSPGRVQWVGADAILAGSQLLEWSTGDSLGTLNLFGNHQRITPQPFDNRCWFVGADFGQPAARLACQSLPDRESLRLAKAIREKTVGLAFGPGVPIKLVTEGSIPAPAVEQLKKTLEARKYPLGDGGVTLTIRLTEGGGQPIKIREMPGNRITTVPGLSITGEAILTDAKGEIWKTSYKNGTTQGFGMIRTNDLTAYFHKPIRDGAENWVRSLPLPRGIARDGAKLIPYPNVIKLVGD